MSPGLSWKVVNTGNGAAVSLAGPIDEEANFAPLASELSAFAKLQIDLGAVSRINSCGVREWIRFMRMLPATSQVELHNCTPTVVSQLNMINNFAGAAKVFSVHAPFVCTGCAHEQVDVLDLKPGVIPELSGRTCSQCGGELEFDDLADSYFAFMRGQSEKPAA